MGIFGVFLAIFKHFLGVDFRVKMDILGSNFGVVLVKISVDLGVVLGVIWGQNWGVNWGKYQKIQ